MHKYFKIARHIWCNILSDSLRYRILAAKDFKGTGGGRKVGGVQQMEKQKGRASDKVRLKCEIVRITGLNCSIRGSCGKLCSFVRETKTKILALVELGFNLNCHVDLKILNTS